MVMMYKYIGFKTVNGMRGRATSFWLNRYHFIIFSFKTVNGMRGRATNLINGGLKNIFDLVSKP